MKRSTTGTFALLFSLFMLAACSPKNPEEVTGNFWRAVIANDAKDAVKYSTLGDVRDFDGFQRNWAGFTPSFGKIVIDGDNAHVATTLTKTTSSGDDSVKFDTILIRQDDKWKVDYTQTAKEVKGGPFSRLFGQLERVGKSISDQFSATSDQLTTEMNRMGDQLAELSQSLGDRATEIIDQQGEELRKNIKEFSESTRRALKEYDDSLSDKDRKVLQEVSDDLDEQSDKLSSKPTLKSIADGGKSIAVANQRLGAIDNDALESYKKQWQEWGKKTEEEMQKFLEQLSSIANQS